jgi:uncharacterized protein YjeT (DUF2065 family)
MNFFISVIGMVMIIEGLPYFLSPEKAKSWMGKIEAIPGETLRTIGFFMMAIGLFLVYMGRG